MDEALRADARRRRTRRAGLAAAVLLVAIAASLWPGQTGHPPITGAVAGYIQPCSGLPFPQFTSTGERLFSAAATVEALRGREYWKPVGHGSYRVVMPTVVAARERVGQNQVFLLDQLAPGHYVILAQYAGGNVSTFLDVSISAGRVADLKLPNMCI